MINTLRRSSPLAGFLVSSSDFFRTNEEWDRRSTYELRNISLSERLSSIVPTFCRTNSSHS